MSNPFATRFVEPGAVSWIGEGEHSLGEIFDRFSAYQHRGAVIGPHGSGKSTLLEHLVPMLGEVLARMDVDGELREGEYGPEAGIIWVRVRDPKRISWSSLRKFWSKNRILIVDGWDQLSWIKQTMICIETGLAGMGLLVTSHCHRPGPFPLGLCVFHHTDVSGALARQVVKHLAPNSQFSELDLMTRLAMHQGNFREVLMDLFDEYQTRSKRIPSQVC